jgi:DNA-binding phage protein
VIIKQLTEQALARLLLMNQQGESWSNIAARCGMNRSTLFRLMEGELDPRVSTLDKILAVTHPKLEVK